MRRVIPAWGKLAWRPTWDELVGAVSPTIVGNRSPWKVLQRCHYSTATPLCSTCTSCRSWFSSSSMVGTLNDYLMTGISEVSSVTDAGSRTRPGGPPRRARKALRRSRFAARIPPPQVQCRRGKPAGRDSRPAQANTARPDSSPRRRAAMKAATVQPKQAAATSTINASARNWGTRFATYTKLSNSPPKPSSAPGHQPAAGHRQGSP